MKETPQATALASLNTLQRSIVTYLLDKEKATRKEVLEYLFARGFFRFRGKVLSRNSADRLLRATITDIINAGIPLCSNSADGYYFPATEKDVEHATAELESRAVEIRKRSDGLHRAASLWFGIPQKPISNKSNIAINQLNLFSGPSCAADVIKYLPEGGDIC